MKDNDIKRRREMMKKPFKQTLKVVISTIKKMYIKRRINYTSNIEFSSIMARNMICDNEKFKKLVIRYLSIYNKYFKKQGKICVSISERIMAKHFKVSLGTIHNWIHKLKDEGFIKIEQVQFGSSKKCKIYNIYILGGLSKTGERIYYADIV